VPIGLGLALPVQKAFGIDAEPDSKLMTIYDWSDRVSI
jgi:hypothetical protein